MPCSDPYGEQYEQECIEGKYYVCDGVNWNETGFTCGAPFDLGQLVLIGGMIGFASLVVYFTQFEGGHRRLMSIL